MKIKFFIALILFLAVVAGSARPQEAPKPLTKDEVMGLAKNGMETPELVKLIREHGINFDVALIQERGIGFSPTSADLGDIRKAGATDDLIRVIQAAAQ